MQSILLIDHGSRRTEANLMLECMANLVQTLVGASVAVRHAHMELAEPSISAGVDACVAAGATEVIAFPYMLSPGRHSTSDIPSLVAQAARRHEGVAVRTTDAFGVDEKLAEIVLLRTGIRATASLNHAAAACCWHPAEAAGACGDACRARAVIERQDRELSTEVGGFSL